MGCETGLCSPGMCTRKSSVLSRLLPLVWRRLIAAAWDPKVGSLLELAEACDVPVRWSCRIGVCHTRMTGVIGGSIIYNPEPLERPLPGTYSYAVPSQTRVSLWIFERNGIE